MRDPSSDLNNEVRERTVMLAGHVYYVVDDVCHVCCRYEVAEVRIIVTRYRPSPYPCTVTVLVSAPERCLSEFSASKRVFCDVARLLHVVIILETVVGQR